MKDPKEINCRNCFNRWWCRIETYQAISRIYNRNGYSGGYPNEHLAGDSDGKEISSPMYATAVGLVMNSIQNGKNSAVKYQPEIIESKPVYRQPVASEQVRRRASRGRNRRGSS